MQVEIKDTERYPFFYLYIFKKTYLFLTIADMQNSKTNMLLLHADMFLTFADVFWSNADVQSKKADMFLTFADVFSSHADVQSRKADMFYSIALTQWVFLYNKSCF